MDRTKPPGIRILQIFLERALFSHRADSMSLSPATTIQADVSVEVQAGYSPDRKRGRCRVRVHTDPTKKPIYDVDLVITALLAVDESQPNMSMEQYVTKYAPTMLYPFVRQAMADITGRGRFGSLWLSPVNLAAAVPPTLTAGPDLLQASRKVQRARRAKKGRR